VEQLALLPGQRNRDAGRIKKYAKGQRQAATVEGY